MLDATWDNLDRAIYRDMLDIETAYLTNLNPSPKSGSKALLGRSPILPMTFELGAPSMPSWTRSARVDSAVFLAEDLAVQRVGERVSRRLFPGLREDPPDLCWHLNPVF